MPKHYKEMIDELINKMDEDAPANSVAGGGVDMNPTGAKMLPKMMKRIKQVNESLSKVEDKSDEKLGLKQDVDIEEKEYKTFRDKYNA